MSKKKSTKEYMEYHEKVVMFNIVLKYVNLSTKILHSNFCGTISN